MKPFNNPLSRKQRAGCPDAIHRIQATTRALLQLPDDVTVSVTQLSCRASTCSDIETIVAVLKAGRQPVTVRFRKRAADIWDIELAAALNAINGEFET